MCPCVCGWAHSELADDAPLSSHATIATDANSCHSLQQLDKEPWEAVRREMTEEKGLRGSVADRIGAFVTYKGRPKALHAKVCVLNWVVREGGTE